MARLRYSKMQSTLGELTVAASPSGICMIWMGVGFKPSAPGFDLVESEDELLRGAKEALDAYLQDRARTFDLPLDLGLATSFSRRILKLLMEVPYGELTSYGALAAAAGTSARAVGGAVGSNPIPIVIPCHRVVAADGSLGGFSGGLDRKRALLALEGHEPLSGGWAPRRRKVWA
jgi:methylated-DNA-[protein]-cysteine S-methyltransferase